MQRHTSIRHSSMHTKAQEADRQRLVTRLEKEIDMYKFHVDLAVKIAPAILAIAGAILAWIGTKDRSSVPCGLSASSLFIPLLLCVGICVIYWKATTAAQQMEATHRYTAGALGIAPFNMGPLAGVCRVGYVLCGVASVGIALVIAWLLKQSAC
jgi:hypothetical protein